MRCLALLLLVLLSAPVFGQSFDFSKYDRSPLDKYSSAQPAAPRPLAKLQANPYDSKSLSNPYGAGSPYKLDGINNPYSKYGSPYSPYSATNPYATKAPKIYGSDGAYHGRLSANPYAPDSTSNQYGKYGSRYSPSSINNPYGAGSRYRTMTRPLYVYPGGR